MQDQAQKKRLKPRHIFLCCLVCLALLAVLTVSQEAKLKEIAAEQAILTEDYEKLLLEEQRLERMLEYAGTDAYVEQFAREKLGYVWPEDYKFYNDDATGEP